MSSKYFGADEAVLDKVSARKAKEIFGIVLGIIEIIFGSYCSGRQDDLSVRFDPDSYEYYGILEPLSYIIGGITIITSVILYILNSKKYDALSKCYINVTEEKVSGSIIEPGEFSSYTRSFSVNISDIIDAVVIGENVPDKPNIRINTKMGSFECTAIENKHIAAKLINELVSAKLSVPEIPNSDNRFDSTPGLDGGFCMWCGIRLPKGAVFCGACEKKQMELNK